jgi:hypothetical protein
MFKTFCTLIRSMLHAMQSIFVLCYDQLFRDFMKIVLCFVQIIVF